MNQEVIKAINKSKSESKSIFKTIKNWWRANNYKIFRIILFPIWIVEMLVNKYNSWKDAQNKWDEARANEILNYYIPRYCEWNDKEKSFYFFDNGMGWNSVYAKKYLKRKDRHFWKVNCGWWGGDMRQYLLSTFELEGFTKEIGNCWEGWTEITFYLNEEK